MHELFQIFEQALQEEREASNKALAKIEESKDEELEKCRRKLEMLDEKVEELQSLLKRSINSPPLLLETVATPPEKQKNPKIKQASQLTESSRSASYNNLMSIDNTNAKKTKKKLSPETTRFQTTEKRRSFESTTTERRSITELVADSLQNPISMTAIRQELKGDNLTPRIQRKLQKKTNSQTMLPSLSNGSSPTNRTNESPQRTSPSPNNSPRTRHRWSHSKQALKDSAI